MGTSIVDALDREEEGTILELGFGIWVIPFSDKCVLNAIGLGAGVKFPLTEREESSSSYLFRARYDFNWSINQSIFYSSHNPNHILNLIVLIIERAYIQFFSSTTLRKIMSTYDVLPQLINALTK